MPGIYAFSVEDLLQVVNHLRILAKMKDIVYGIFVLTCWRIWKARNEKVFSSM
ncbi:hypothetical protein Hanom_Chr02g00151761 [Helianthus anomalus]